jgi:hypothetical protein
MKAICDKNGWSYKESDTAKPLIKTVARQRASPSLHGDAPRGST